MNVTAIFAYTSAYGSEKANLEVFRILKKAGHEVKLIVRNDIPLKLEKSIKEHNFQSFRINWGPDYLGFKNSFINNLKAVYRMITISLKLLIYDKSLKTEVLYVPNYIQFFFVWFYLVFTNKKTVFRIGDIPSVGFFHILMWKYFINPRVNFFVCNSDYGKYCLLKNIGDDKASKIKVIRNIYNEKILEKAKNINDLSQFRCLYVGQLNEHKGANIAIEAALKVCESYNNYTFSFVGEDPSFNRLIKKQILKIKNDKRLNALIKFHGFVPHKDLKKHYLNSNLLIVPSVFEDSSPNVVLEARYLGLPIVAFEVGGIPELVEHEQTGYLCREKTMDFLIKGIFFVCSSKEKYKKLSEKSLLLPQDFSSKFIEKSWCDLFNNVNLVS